MDDITRNCFLKSPVRKDKISDTKMKWDEHARLDDQHKLEYMNMQSFYEIYLNLILE